MTTRWGHNHKHMFGFLRQSPRVTTGCFCTIFFARSGNNKLLNKAKFTQLFRGIYNGIQRD
ncbi:hypothetical protein DRJ48_02060 [Candidatus Woesearchaeota archaeon]|nr:MAG: hypothetical protein DRJ48_02060 [Candidatus Woesearchaeota archaeon]